MTSEAAAAVRAAGAGAGRSSEKRATRAERAETTAAADALRLQSAPGASRGAADAAPTVAGAQESALRAKTANLDWEGERGGRRPLPRSTTFVKPSASDAAGPVQDSLDASLHSNLDSVMDSLDLLSKRAGTNPWA